MALIETTLTFMSLVICLADLFKFLLTLSPTSLITFFDQAVHSLPLLGWSSDVPSSLKSVPNMVHSGFNLFQELNNLSVFPSGANKAKLLPFFFSLFEKLMKIILMALVIIFLQVDRI